ncbi:hypothetical protein [Nocardia sp. NPDC003963]
MNGWVRAGIGFLAASQTGVGIWALFFPVTFFSLEFVGMGMAYNEHLMRDYGAMTLASAVVLGVATVQMGRMLTVVALAMYLTWSVPHFVVHLTMLDHLAPSTGAVLITALGAAVVLSAGLLVCVVSSRPSAS